MGEDWGGVGDPSERKQLCCVAPLPWQEGPLPACPPPHVRRDIKGGDSRSLCSAGVSGQNCSGIPRPVLGLSEGGAQMKGRGGKRSRNPARSPSKRALPSRSAPEGWGLQRGDVEELNQGCQGPPDRLRLPDGNLTIKWGLPPHRWGVSFSRRACEAAWRSQVWGERWSDWPMVVQQWLPHCSRSRDLGPGLLCSLEQRSDVPEWVT